MSSLSPHTEVGYVKRNKRKGKPYGNYIGYYRFPDEVEITKINLQIRDKRFAEQKLRELIEQTHAVRTGLKPSDELLNAAAKPLAEYIEDYVLSMKARKLKHETIRKIGPMLRRLFNDCEWNRISDLSASGFESWRASVALSSKAQNHHLNTAKAFTNWLITIQVCERNPFKGIKPARVIGNETRPRRALNIDEVDRLVKHCPCPRRRMIYMIAFATAARSSEMKGFRWSDIHLCSNDPAITYRNSNTKSTKPERNPIPHWLADSLREFKPENAKPDDLVFSKWIGNHSLNKDLERAGIPKHNAHGESACLYSLRHGFNQTMLESNIPFRHAQRLMRHSDPKHTANTYLDSDGLNLRESIDKLPAVGEHPRVARSVVEVVEERLGVSVNVAVNENSDLQRTAIAVSGRESMTPNVAECPDHQSKWSRGESNPRPGIVSRVLLRV